MKLAAIRVEVTEGERTFLGWGRDEGACWWVRFDDGSAYSVPRERVREVPA